MKKATNKRTTSEREIQKIRKLASPTIRQQKEAAWEKYIQKAIDHDDDIEYEVLIIIKDKAANLYREKSLKEIQKILENSAKKISNRLEVDDNLFIELSGKFCDDDDEAYWIEPERHKIKRRFIVSLGDIPRTT
jgi:hypothetical protein